MKLHQIKLARDRRTFIEKKTGTDLGNIGSFTFDEKTVSSRNCENMIGGIQVPLGVAGPINLKSNQETAKQYYVPLATTEGALVASVSRGCKAISESGGADVFAYHAGVVRAPVFYIPSLKQQQEFSRWLTDRTEAIRSIAEDTSSHLKFLDVETIVATPYVFLRLKFDTGDAMGMNMVTIASEQIVSYIQRETGIRCLALSGNADVDKKPAWRNIITHRGWVASAEVLLSGSVIADVLKTNAAAMYAVWVSKYMIGSAVSGSMGYNAHVANVLAAMFIATGQDVAHVAECAAGMVVCEQRGDDLFIFAQLPDLMVGTVGGGTGLATQQEALSIMGIAGEGKAEEFAEIVAGAVLAGEISLMASLAEGSLARAHRVLSRGEHI